MYRIFLVEDDETIAKLVRRHLEKWDYDVLSAPGVLYEAFKYTAAKEVRKVKIWIVLSK